MMLADAMFRNARGERYINEILSHFCPDKKPDNYGVASNGLLLRS